MFLPFLNEIISPHDQLKAQNPVTDIFFLVSIFTSPIECMFVPRKTYIIIFISYLDSFFTPTFIAGFSLECEQQHVFSGQDSSRYSCRSYRSCCLDTLDSLDF